MLGNVTRAGRSAGQARPRRLPPSKEMKCDSLKKKKKEKGLRDIKQVESAHVWSDGALKIFGDVTTAPVGRVGGFYPVILHPKHHMTSDT